jgi:hypothetical protein
MIADPLVIECDLREHGRADRQFLVSRLLMSSGTALQRKDCLDRADQDQSLGGLTP